MTEVLGMIKRMGVTEGNENVIVMTSEEETAVSNRDKAEIMVK